MLVSLLPVFLSKRVPRTGVRMRCKSELPSVIHQHTPPTGEHLTLLTVDFVPLNTNQLFHLEFHQRICDPILTLEESLAGLDLLKDAALLCN